MNQYCQSLAEIQTFKKNKTRSLLRHFSLNILSTIQPKINLPDNLVWFITLHNLFPEYHERFRQQLKFLSENFKFISHSEAVVKLKSNSIDGRYISMSVDDGYQNCIDIAHICQEFDAKLIFYCNPSIIGIDQFEDIKMYCAQNLKSPPVAFLSWAQLEQLKKMGHEIGNHGLEHLNLSYLTLTQLEHEIGFSKHILEKKIGKVNHYAWAFGRAECISTKAIDYIYKAGHKTISGLERKIYSEGLSEMVSIIHREVIEPNDPIDHVQYFLQKSIAKMQRA